MVYMGSPEREEATFLLLPRVEETQMHHVGLHIISPLLVFASRVSDKCD